MGQSSKRSAILKAASRLFAEKGYSRTTTAEIAQAAEVAEGTLYHHFESKDGIFLTIFEEMVEEYLSGAETIARDGKTGAETLSGLIRFHFAFLERNQTRFLVILRDFPSHLAEDGGRPARSRNRFGRMTDILCRVLAKGQEDGTLRSNFAARDTACLLRGILSGTTRHSMLGIADVPLPRLCEMVEGYCLRALSSDGMPGIIRRDADHDDHPTNL